MGERGDHEASELGKEGFWYPFLLKFTKLEKNQHHCYISQLQTPLSLQ